MESLSGVLPVLTRTIETNRQPLVSVIVIFFNAEKFLSEALDSVLGQTYSNWELLLVDDGSTDQSTAMAQQYCERYPEQVSYFEHPGHQNKGMSASRNLGIQKAKGSYIALLDADDVWLPTTLAEQVLLLESHPDAAMVYGPIQWWYSWTGDVQDRKRDFLQPLRIQADSLVRPPTLLRIFLEHEGSKPAGILVRRKSIDKIGGFEETFTGMYEDQVFCAKLCLQEQVYVSSASWYKYRQHKDSCCAIAVRTKQYRSQREKFLDWLETYLVEHHVQDPGIDRALGKALMPYRHPILHRLFGAMKQFSRRVARQSLPVPLRNWLRARWQGQAFVPPVGWIRFGSLRRLTPISRQWGFDRGLPIDRYYIEQFLTAHMEDIHGRVLEIGDATYTYRFGGSRVTKSDILHAVAGNPQATIVADLTCAEEIPSETFDSIVLTQTLQLIYDVQAALDTIYRILKPGGVLLATFPGISQISRRQEPGSWGDRWCWSFTTLSARQLFEKVFPATHISIEAFGNVLTTIAFLHGLASQELHQSELGFRDADYEMLVAVRAMKPMAT
jgi:glycosyltransferase involved in cell wall biosynthesis